MRGLLIAAVFLCGCVGNVSNTTPDASLLPDGGMIPQGDGGTGAGCDVLALLQARCVSCHGDVPTEGAPMPLTRLADLRAPTLRTAT